MQVEHFDYALFAKASTLERIKCSKEGHLARACHNRPGLAAGPLPWLHRLSLQSRGPFWLRGVGDSMQRGTAGSDRVAMVPQVEE